MNIYYQILGNSEIFKKNIIVYQIEFTKDYNLIKTKKDEKWKTVFKIKYKNFQYQIIFLKLINISMFYQIIINKFIFQSKQADNKLNKLEIQSI